MLNSRGFTMVELMVACTIATVLLGIVGLYLSASGTFSRQLTQSGAARENLYTALELIRQDIMQAGTGLTSLDSDASSTVGPSLAIFVANMHSEAPWGWDQLYLSYSKFLNPKYAASSTVAGALDPTDTSLENPNLFTHRAWRKYPTFSSSDGNPITLDAGGLHTSVTDAIGIVHQVIGPYDIGYLIGSDGTVIQLSPNIRATGDATGLFTFVGATPTNGVYYVPAVSYQCPACHDGAYADTEMPALTRNVNVNGKSTVLFGGGPLVRVTNFRAKIQYSVSGAPEAQPRPNGQNSTTFNPFLNQPPTNNATGTYVSFVEVRIFYQFRNSDGTWPTNQIAALMRAVPRGMGLARLFNQ